MFVEAKSDKGKLIPHHCLLGSKHSFHIARGKSILCMQYLEFGDNIFFLHIMKSAHISDR